MSNDRFAIIIRRYAEFGGGSLSLTPVNGDPLIDKELAHKIRFARKFSQITEIEFYTNLIALGNHDLDSLLLSGVDRIRISTCIGDRAMYERVFGVDRYDSVMANLQSILLRNQELGYKVDIAVSLRVERPYYRVFSSPDYRRIFNLAPTPPRMLNVDYWSWAGLLDESALPRGHRLRRMPQDRTEPCSQLYGGLIVFEDGEAGICNCADLNASLVVGNVIHQPFFQVWTGDRLLAIRADWTKTKPKICQRCDNYSPLSLFMAIRQKEILQMAKQSPTGVP